ncbi:MULTISPECIES: hypothetical protein [unclassified Cellvibrio]|uniref:hypothetical protein n=1 Tax=unclassified Cellvibrio TaxID=2624793 RepID=UPI00058FF2C6|nr:MULTISPECIES: hypothetical protein [unclassified Cellvibrio]QEY12221.1 hypothetical protein D0B88_08110 [Cellvibrio sp. KY-YJ-3]
MNRKLFLLIITVFSGFAHSENEWCSYEIEKREPSLKELISCPSEKANIEYESSLNEFKSLIQSIKSKHPDLAKEYQRIEANMLDLIEKHRLYIEAKCNFEFNNYILELYPTAKGSEGDYDSAKIACEQSYKIEASKKIREVITSCNTIDEVYELPCIW